MKINLSRDALNIGLQNVLSCVNPRPTVTVLGNVLLTADKDRLTLLASDLNVTIQAEVPATVARAGSATLPARRLQQIARDLPQDDVEIQINEKDHGEIRCGASFFRLNGMPAEDFPQPGEVEQPKTYQVEQRVLKTMLLRTVYAASGDESRPVLTGVLMSFRDEKLTVVATDGRRMALAEQELEFATADEAEFVLPAKSVHELAALLQDEGTVRILAGAKRMAFTGTNFTLQSKLLDGVYPNYRQVIPEACDQRLTLEREAFMNAVRRVALLTSESSQVVKLILSRNNVEITATTPDVGEARESVPVKYAGGKMEVSFNPDYLVDPLKNLVSDEVFFEIRDEASPGVIKSADPFLYVIMPVRIG